MQPLVDERSEVGSQAEKEMGPEIMCRRGHERGNERTTMMMTAETTATTNDADDELVQ